MNNPPLAVKVKNFELCILNFELKMKSIWRYILGFLVLGAVSVWLTVFTFPDKNLHLIACDVGQGDAILTTYGNVQVLTDGGADNKVLSCLSRHMPFWDREIEMVVLTHPQLDHFGGLVEVFKRYKVDTFLGNSVDASSSGYQVLKKEIESSQAQIVNPSEGMMIRLGKIHYDIVNPPQNFDGAVIAGQAVGVLGAFTASRDLNDYSVVANLSYDNFRALLTGDIDQNMIPDILKTGRIEKVDYLKVPHHGSKNGLTKELLDATDPKVAVISVGKNNRYGHPHEEVLKLLRETGTKVLRTDKNGEVEVITDGKKWWMKN